MLISCGNFVWKSCMEIMCGNRLWEIMYGHLLWKSCIEVLYGNRLWMSCMGIEIVHGSNVGKCYMESWYGNLV